MGILTVSGIPDILKLRAELLKEAYSLAVSPRVEVVHMCMPTCTKPDGLGMHLDLCFLQRKT